ncbi:MAG: type II secretion system protein [Halofilum sp. (in: g-proteobacteria)]|nr:type II secretion system protein [Halofilum sp. (in: g-proteobacteria)]
MTNKQQGFTLIELVAVIVILGALAVVALPRFINLQDEAEQAAAEGVAGSASSAHSR